MITKSVKKSRRRDKVKLTAKVKINRINWTLRSNRMRNELKIGTKMVVVDVALRNNVYCHSVYVLSNVTCDLLEQIQELWKRILKGIGL